MPGKKKQKKKSPAVKLVATTSSAPTLADLFNLSKFEAMQLGLGPFELDVGPFEATPKERKEQNLLGIHKDLAGSELINRRVANTQSRSSARQTAVAQNRFGDRNPAPGALSDAASAARKKLKAQPSSADSNLKPVLVDKVEEPMEEDEDMDTGGGSRLTSETMQDVRRGNAGPCPVGPACKFGKNRRSRECPFDTDELQSFYEMAGGQANASRAQIAAALQSNSTAEAKATCAVLTKLYKGDRTFLDWRPDPAIVQQKLAPAAYLDYVAKTGQFEKPVHAMEIKEAEMCKLSDNKTTLGQVLKLSKEQEFYRHYFTPQSHLPGLLLSSSTGSGKTITAISVATSSWTFKGYTVAWVTELKRKADFIAEAISHMGNMTNKVMAESDTTGEMAERFTQMQEPERKQLVDDDPNFVTPMSYKEFLNTLKGQAPSMKRSQQIKFPLVADENGNKPRIVLIIDEVHLLLDYLRKEGYDVLHMIKLFEQARAADFDSLKVICITATPLYHSEVQLMQLLRMVGAQHNLEIALKAVTPDVRASWPTQFPRTRDELDQWIDPQTGLLHADAYELMRLSCLGLVSYMDVTHDATRFPQIASDTAYNIEVTDVQVQAVRDCDPHDEAAREEDENELPHRKIKGRRRGRGGARVTKVAVASCGDENFTTYDKEYYADSPGFANRMATIQHDMYYLSPKFQALYMEMMRRDAEVAAKEGAGKRYKHVIYCHQKRTAKMVWSMLIASKYARPYEQPKFKGVDPKRPTVALLVEGENAFGNKITPAYINELIGKGGKFNDKKNRNGSEIGVLVIDDSVATGFDMLDVRYLHLFEDTPSGGRYFDEVRHDPRFAPTIDALIAQKLADWSMTQQNGPLRSDSSKVVQLRDVAEYEVRRDFDYVAKQLIGRVTRMCGSHNLGFEDGAGWTVDVVRYFAMLSADAEKPVYYVPPSTTYRVEKERGKEKEDVVRATLLRAQLETLLLAVTIDRFLPPFDQPPLSAQDARLGYVVEEQEPITQTPLVV